MLNSRRAPSDRIHPPVPVSSAGAVGGEPQGVDDRVEPGEDGEPGGDMRVVARMSASCWRSRHELLSGDGPHLAAPAPGEGGSAAAPQRRRGGCEGRGREPRAPSIPVGLARHPTDTKGHVRLGPLQRALALSGVSLDVPLRSNMRHIGTSTAGIRRYIELGVRHRWLSQPRV